jgi:chromosome segregation ATPase
MKPPFESGNSNPNSSETPVVAESATSSDSSLRTKKFHLEKSLKQELKKYAEKHYQGNASQFIRAAIKDHVRTLEGESEYDLKKLQIKLEKIEETLAELRQTISESNHSQPSVQHQQSQLTQQIRKQSDSDEQSPPPSGRNSRLQTRIYRSLEDADSLQLTLGELSQQTDSDISELASTIETLVDRGLLRSVSHTEQPTYAINSQENKNE